MADANFAVKNGLVVANTITANSTAFYWNGTQFLTQTAFTGTANNATNAYGKTEGALNANSAAFLGSTAASGYQTTAGLSANVAALTANNANFLGGSAAATFLNTGSSPTVSGTWNFSGTVNFTGTYNPALGNLTTQNLTDGGTITPNCASGPVWFVTLGGNRTIAAPSNPKIGTYLMYITQDGTGNRTLTWNSIFKWPGGVAPVLTGTASAIDLISLTYNGSVWMGSFLPDMK